MGLPPSIKALLPYITKELIPMEHNSNAKFAAKKTYNAQALKDHTKRAHTEEKPFTCDLCQYSTKIKGDLRIHKNRMDNNQLFKCQICVYTCKAKQDLKRHEKNQKHKALSESTETSDNIGNQTLKQSGFSKAELVKEMSQRRLVIRIEKLQKQQFM